MTKNKWSIKQHRTHLGLTQKEFAAKVGIKHSTYQSKESGKRDWKAFEIKQIALNLKISVSEIDF